jgi:succinylarginine dihydrolase
MLDHWLKGLQNALRDAMTHLVARISAPLWLFACQTTNGCAAGTHAFLHATGAALLTHGTIEHSSNTQAMHSIFCDNTHWPTPTDEQN